MKRKIFAMVLAITMTVSGIPSAVWADEVDKTDVSVEVFDEVEAVGGDSVTIVESGECGENTTYLLDSEGTLVISGSGEMWNYHSYYGDNYSESPFLRNEQIKNLVIGEGITSIGSGMFWCCSELRSANIPESMTSIGHGAFSGCSGLISLDIPEVVTSIGGYAFAECNKLTSVTFPKRVTSISDGVFCNCSGLTSLDIPEDVTSIGTNAFAGCSGLTSLDIPKVVTSIGGYAFSGCSGLISLDIPESVTNIGIGAFSECSGLTSVIIPGSVPKLDKLMFSHCNGLTSVNIRNGVISICEGAFRDCNGLTSVIIPASVMSIEVDAFDECDSLTNIEVDENNQNYSSNAGVVFNKNKETIWMCPRAKTGEYEIPEGVKGIYAEAFNNCSGLTCVTIPVGVTYIGMRAFKDCNRLTSVTIPESVTSIGYCAFENCSGLTSINIPESVTSIGMSVFSGCDNLTIYCQKDSYAHMYAIQEGIPYRFGQPPTENPQTYTVSFDANGGTGLTQNSRTIIQGEALGNLPSVTCPGYTLTGWYTAKTGGTAVTKDTVVTSNLTVYAQWKADVDFPPARWSLADAEITLSQTSYSYDGSEKKPAVKSVKLGNITLKSGTDYTVEYQNNKNIGTATVAITGKGNYTGTAAKTFTIRAKTGTTITSGAYKYKITSSTEAAFAGLKSSTTKKVTIPKTVNIGGKTFKVTSINAKALQNTKVTSVTIGANVKTIGSSAFAGCGKLSKVTIANSVTKIGSSAFKNCAALKSVTIPAKVTAIGTGAFSGCKKLAMITVKSTKLKSVGKNAFKGIKSTAKMKVPSKKLTAYQKLFKGKGQGTDVKIIK